MFNKLFPDKYFDSVYDIDYGALRLAGVSYLVFDIDNTLAPFDVSEPYPQTIKLFADLRFQGFNICLLSNNSHARVEAFNARLGVASVARARKPGRGGLHRALAQLGAANSNTAIIGDQIFTDVWCAKRNGLLSVLVKPVCPGRDEFMVRIKRVLEKYVIRQYLKGC